MARFYYDEVIKYKISAKTRSPLHIGGAFGENQDILVNPVTGEPFIQASSLAGMFRSESRVINGDEITNKLFGTPISSSSNELPDSRSIVKITDGRMELDTVKLEVRPGIAIDRKTGSVNNDKSAGQKYDITYIAADAIFVFFLYLYVKKEEKELQKRLESTLAILNNDEARIGAKKSNGAGSISAESIQKVIYDLTTDAGRKKWISESEEVDTYQDIAALCSTESRSIKYDIRIDAMTDGPIQIKGVSMSEFGKDAPDSENIRNGKNDFIIPGSSVKGAIRSQMEKIAAYLDKNIIIRNSFGYKADSHTDSFSGNLRFNDVVIGDVADIDRNPVRNRIHIDKFTGGVISQALFKEKNASGNLSIEIQIVDKNNPEATLGLLLYALRDLAMNLYNLGNGFAIGKGFLKVSKISINRGDGKSEIRFEDGNNRVIDESSLIDNALKALREVQG